MSSSLTDECNLLREYFQSTWLKCRLLPGKMNIQRLIGHGVTSKMSHQRRMGLIGKALFEDMNVTLWNEDNVTYLKHTKKAQTPKPKPKPLKVLKEGDKTGWFNVHVPVYSHSEYNFWGNSPSAYLQPGWLWSYFSSHDQVSDSWFPWLRSHQEFLTSVRTLG